MAIAPKSKPKWVKDFLKRAARPVPPGVLELREQAAERILANRVDIRPERVEDYIRAIREDEDDG